MGWGSDARAAGDGGRVERGGGSHRKAGPADKGKNNIDKSGRTGKRHAGFLSGSTHTHKNFWGDEVPDKGYHRDFWGNVVKDKDTGKGGKK